MIESLVLCVCGGIIGIILGLGIGTLLGNMGYTFSSNTSTVIISFLSSSVIGVVFGIFPANKASRLNPIDALHTD